MGGYIANFTVYTMAMAGLICFAVFVYKKVMDGSFRSNDSNFLGIEETISLNPRKTLHVVRAGNEKFLIASDVDRTTLISKLGESAPAQKFTIPQQIFEQQEEIPVQKPVQQRVHLEPVKVKNPEVSHIRKGMDRREAYRKIQTNNVQSNIETQSGQAFSTMREMAKKINEL